MAQRDSKARAYVASMDVKAMTSAVASKAPKEVLTVRRTPNRIRINDFSTLGKLKSLVILIQFSDVKFTSMANPKQFYHDMLNKEGFTYSNGANGSAHDFYLTSSMGQFDPEFVVAGPVTLPHEATYYGSERTDRRIYKGKDLLHLQLSRTWWYL